MTPEQNLRCPYVGDFGWCRKDGCWANVNGPCEWMQTVTVIRTYLWTTNTHLEHAWGIARSWGFTPKQILTWCKKPKGMIGFGTFSPCTEFVLFAATGERAIHHGRCERTWWEWPRTLKHSAKPIPFFDVVEKVSPGPYLEMFARDKRNGWHAWGNEVHSDVALA